MCLQTPDLLAASDRELLLATVEKIDALSLALAQLRENFSQSDIRQLIAPESTRSDFSLMKERIATLLRCDADLAAKKSLALDELLFAIYGAELDRINRQGREFQAAGRALQALGYQKWRGQRGEARVWLYDRPQFEHAE